MPARASMPPPSDRQGRFSAVVAFPFGKLGVRVGDGLVQEISYLPQTVQAHAPVDELAREVMRQVGCYVDSPDYRFELPLAPVGSQFQRAVWRAICAIPAAETATYGQLARSIGGAARAVGSACGANWFPIVIPCHRVVGANDIGGFCGSGANADVFTGAIKRWLLAHEQRVVQPALF